MPNFPFFDFEILFVGVSTESKIRLVAICGVVRVVIGLFVDSEGGLGIGVGFVLYENITAVTKYWTVPFDVF